ncbi:PREDICTED: plasminogen-like [Branchiostoma belcheri]|uniref:Plasminogen-like n=1 Tax=Branchiostoma belcheri TaxID=7741 RepID=A0A6P5A056_BRABE|nr:PREDICTED: plasminogen-like [Branchiostoma belcheri]
MGSVGGQLEFVSVGSKGVWGVNHLDDVFYHVRGFDINPSNLPVSWDQTEGTLKLKQISSGRSVWGISANGDVLIRLGMALTYGSTWETVQGVKLKQLDASSNANQLWGVDSNNNIFRRTGISPNRPAGTDWEQIDGSMKFVTVGPAGVWAVDANDDIFYRTGTFGNKASSGSGWKQIEGKLKQISSGDNIVWGVHVNDDIYVREVPSDCQVGNGESYRGTVSVTTTGKTCQRWDSQTPHVHDKTPANNPSAGLEQNYCRNPDGYTGGVWCFTTDPGTEWEACDLPVCVSWDCQVGNAQSYRGAVSVTTTGKTCQRWDSQTPHPHNRTPANHPSAGLDLNYCRNPDGYTGVWCYTTDPGTLWEACAIPECVSWDCLVGNGESYRGTLSVTTTGKTCQRWDSQTPHVHTATPANHPSAGLEQNYCRNPDGYTGVWCYTTDPGTSWEACDVPVCGCQKGNGESYRGAVSVTTTGKTCQRWDSQTPHVHTATPANHPSAGLEQNYCRNPDGYIGVWCYTTDPGTLWEACAVPVCG